MSFDQFSNPFALLSQATRLPAPMRLQGEQLPKLEIAWGSFHQGIGSSLRALLRPSGVTGRFTLPGFFRECWVERRIPGRAVLAAALWHVVFLVVPFPRFPHTQRHFAAFENAELTWSGPINDLPLLELRSARPKGGPRGEAEKPLPAEGRDAFHPRQRIFTDAVHPTHPRQVLVNSAAPPQAPKILPNLPNMVQVEEFVGPAKPRAQLSPQALAMLHPKERHRASVTATPLPEVPRFAEKVGEIALFESPSVPARPKLAVNTGATPRLAAKATPGDVGPAPDVGFAAKAGNANPATLIAISAAPAPPAPVVEAPEGNLAARVSISPEGKQPGAPGGSATGASGGTAGAAGNNGGMSGRNGNNTVEVSISGGNPPKNNGSTGLGVGSRSIAATPHLVVSSPDPRATVDAVPERTGPPNFAMLPVGAQPEQIFASKKIYKLLINMPNLNSATGSWVLNFSELRVNGDAPRTAAGNLSGPAPLRKVDPKYPPTLRNEHVEGEVVLYAVIRRDGSVDSIQLVHGIDELLDANAMEALSQWKFRPGMRDGAPIELEAIVHIPFRTPDLR